MICCLSYINESGKLGGRLILANLCPTPSIQPPRSDVQKSDRSVQNSADGRGRKPRAGEAGRRPRQAERLRAMHRGTRVSLHGLLSRPELNGQPAMLILWDVSAHVETRRQGHLPSWRSEAALGAGSCPRPPRASAPASANHDQPQPISCLCGRQPPRGFGQLALQHAPPVPDHA